MTAAALLADVTAALLVAGVAADVADGGSWAEVSLADPGQADTLTAWLPAYGLALDSRWRSYGRLVLAVVRGVQP